MLHEEGKRLIVVCDAVSAEKDGRCKARNDEQGRKEKFEDCGNHGVCMDPRMFRAVSARWIRRKSVHQ